MFIVCICQSTYSLYCNSSSHPLDIFHILQPVDCANYVIPVTIDNVVHNVYVIKRPGVDEFMRRVGEVYEVSFFPFHFFYLIPFPYFSLFPSCISFPFIYSLSRTSIFLCPPSLLLCVVFCVVCVTRLWCTLHH